MESAGGEVWILSAVGREDFEARDWFKMLAVESNYDHIRADSNGGSNRIDWAGAVRQSKFRYQVDGVKKVFFRRPYHF